MKYRIFSVILIFCFLKVSAQCGISDFCNANSGLFSNSNATDIAYDNMGSSFHSTFIKEPNSEWRVWGEEMAYDGATHLYSP